MNIFVEDDSISKKIQTVSMTILHDKEIKNKEFFILYNIILIYINVSKIFAFLKINLQIFEN